jgi:ribosomal protein L29
MTIAEVYRHIEAREKIRKIEAQEKASYDYILSSLIAKGFCIAMGAKDNFPSIEEVYPEIFEETKEIRKEAIEKKKAELSALRFKQFAQSYNNNRKNKEVLTKDE